MTIKRKKIIFITSFIIIAAFAIVLYVGFFAVGSPDEFDGTLVKTNIILQKLV